MSWWRDLLRGRAREQREADSRAALAQPHPPRLAVVWTPDAISSALGMADGGSLARLSDLYLTIRSSGRVAGIMATRTLGQIALPLYAEGGNAYASRYVLEHWWDAVPEIQLARLLDWGLGIGRGFASIDWDEDDNPTITTWDSRWFRIDDTDPGGATRYYVQTRNGGEEEIYPGDGRWIVYEPYGPYMAHRYALVAALAYPWLLREYALADRAQHSEICGSATWVAATDGLSERQRQALLDRMLAQRGPGKVVMPPGCSLSLLETTGKTSAIYQETIAWADDEVAITIAGQVVTTSGQAGWGTGSIHERILYSLIASTAQSLSTTLREQLTRHWVRRHYGEAEPPWIMWRTMPTEALASRAASLQSLGQAITALDAALSPSGRRVDVEALLDMYGVATIALAPPVEAAPALPASSAPAALANVISLRARRAHAWRSDVAVPISSPVDRVLLFNWGTTRADSKPYEVTLDRAAAEEIIAAQAGRDVMIDLEHLSLRTDLTVDPDARGWGQLEIDDEGLWLVNIRWTSDGERRIVERLQRYVSPAFHVDAEGRVVAIVNVALTALPATHHAQPLIAASVHFAGESMSIEEILALLGMPPETPLADVVTRISEMLATVQAAAGEAMPEAAEALAEAADAAAVAADAAAEEQGAAQLAAMEEELEAARAAHASRGATRAATPEEEQAARRSLAGRLAGAAATSAATPALVALARRVQELEARERRDARETVLREFSSRLTPAIRKAVAHLDAVTLRSVLAALPEQPRSAATQPARRSQSVEDTTALAEVARVTGAPLERLRAGASAGPIDLRSLRGRGTAAAPRSGRTG